MQIRDTIRVTNYCFFQILRHEGIFSVPNSQRSSGRTKSATRKSRKSYSSCVLICIRGLVGLIKFKRGSNTKPETKKGFLWRPRFQRPRLIGREMSKDVGLKTYKESIIHKLDRMMEPSC